MSDLVELGPYLGVALDKNKVTPLAGIKSLLSAKGSTAEVVHVTGSNTVSNSNLFNIFSFEIVKKDGSSVKYDAAQYSASSKGMISGAGAIPVKAVEMFIT